MIRHAIQLALAVAFLAPSCPRLSAQIPPRIKRCPPTDGEVALLAAAGAQCPTRPIFSPGVIIDSVTFDGPVHLSPAAQTKLARKLTHESFDPNSDWISEIKEEEAPPAWRDEGYFQAKIIARARCRDTTDGQQHFTLVLKADEGVQYRLGTFRIASGDPARDLHFSTETLRRLVSLSTGDVVELEQIKKSLERIRELYASNGYANFTAAPTFQLDSNGGVLNGTILLTEGSQYRIGKIQVLGVDQAVAADFRDAVVTGDPFVYERLNRQVGEFLTKHAAALPGDASSEDAHLFEDDATARVNVTLDFRSCPQPAAPNPKL
jgi:hypothetical protein